MQRELSMSKDAQFKLQFQLDATLSDIERYPLRCADVMVITADQYLPEVMVYEKAKRLGIDDLPCVARTAARYYRPLIQEAVPVDQVPTVLALDPSGGGADGVRLRRCEGPWRQLLPDGVGRSPGRR